CSEGVVDLAGDVAFEAADDLFLGLALGCSAVGVGAGFRAVAQPDDGDEVEGAVGVAVAAGVEAVAFGLAGGGGDRVGAAHVRECGFAVDAVNVLSGGDEHLRGVDDAHSEERQGLRCSPSDQSGELDIEVLDLVGEGVDASADAAQRHACRLGWGSARRAGSGRQRAAWVALPASVLAVSDWRTWAGAVTTSWPNWCRAAARACTALARASSSWRMASTTPLVSLGIAVHSPARTLRAAASASIVSFLPRRCRVCACGRSTSTTVTPAVCRCLVSPAPQEPEDSTPTWRIVPYPRIQASSCS